MLFNADRRVMLPRMRNLSGAFYGIAPALPWSGPQAAPRASGCASHLLVRVVTRLEDLVQISSFRRCGQEGVPLFRRHIEVAVLATVAAIDHRQHAGWLVIVHGGDDR